jgi:hypothetical protein
MRPPESRPVREARAPRFAGSLILIVGAVHCLAGAAAVAGIESFEANVLEIEGNADFGSLYFSLETWGLILLLIGVGELIAASRVFSGRSNGLLAGLLVASVGLAAAFASLAIFRWAVLATIPVLLLAILLLSRSIQGHPRR